MTASPTPSLVQPAGSRSHGYLGWSIYWLVTLALLSVSFWHAAQLPGTGAFDRLVLSRENTLGSWWSGMVLLASAGAAGSVAASLWRSDRGGAMGFAGIALLMAGFSLDEMGSLHERAGLLLPWGNHGSLLPPALLGAVVLVTSLVLLLRRRDVFPQTWGMVLVAFGLYGSVYVQEVVEHALTWSAALEGPRLVIEEGTELVATAIILWAMLCAGRALDQPTEARRWDTARALMGLSVLMLVTAMPLIAWARTLPPEVFAPKYGRFTDTPLAMLLALGAWMCGLRWREGGSRAWGWVIAGGLLLVLSAECVAHFRVYFGSESTKLSTAVITGWGILVAGAVMGVAGSSARPKVLALGAAGVLAVLTLLLPTETLPMATVTVAAASLVAAGWSAAKQSPTE